MHAKKPQARAGKGSVQIKSSNGRLQLVFSHPIATSTGEIKSKRFYLSTGQFDNPFGRQQTTVLANKIQRDIDYGEFDASLAKYKPASTLTTVTPILTPEAPLEPSLTDLWEQYTQFKTPQISQSTLAKDYLKY